MPETILFVNRFGWPDESATARMLRGVSDGLADEGFRVAVLCSGATYAGEMYPVANELREPPCSGVRYIRVPTTHFGRASLSGRVMDYLSFYVSAGWWLSNNMSQLRVLVVKTDPPLLGIWLQAIAGRHGTPVLHWTQDIFPEIASVRMGKGMVSKMLRALKPIRNRTWMHSAGVVVVGEDMRRYVCKQEVPEQKVACIENAACASEISPVEPNTNALKKYWGLQEGFVLAYSGNLGRTHDTSVFLKAAEQLARDDSTIFFLFIGGGYGYEQLHRRASYTLRQKMLFKSYQPAEKLSESLGTGDLHWVSLARNYQGLVVPSKIYSIMAAGRPQLFVGDPSSDIARMIEDNRIGRVAASAESFVEHVRHYMENPARLKDDSQRARSHFLHYHEQAYRTTKWKKILANPATDADDGI